MSRPLALAFLLTLGACGSSETEGTTASAETPASEPAATSPAEPATPPDDPAAVAPAATPSTPSSLDTATACARARPCCAGFVEAIGDPVEAERARIACEQMDHLEELGEASGEACLAAIDGWRRTLEDAEREVPVSCR